jgi:hypothetical protein
VNNAGFTGKNLSKKVIENLHISEKYGIFVRSAGVFLPAMQQKNGIHCSLSTVFFFFI